MTSTTGVQDALDDTARAAIDTAVDELRDGVRVWSRLSLGQRARLLERIRVCVASVAEEWADTAAAAKDLEPSHPLRGEEWLLGPYPVVDALDVYARTLRALVAGRSPLDGVRLDTDAPGGRLRARVFPLTATDALLVSGHRGEVWFAPGITAAQARERAGLAQRTPREPGGVGLVLGAGNVSAIPVLDVLYELLAYNRVVVLKLNPTQDLLAPVFRRALAPLLQLGLLRIVLGGADVGAALTRHPGIDHVHITGSADTFDAIVWGKDAAARRSAGTPTLTVPITAELGGVSPIIVVPGRWRPSDLRFQAEHIATMRLHNSGHNCLAGQVVILSDDWDQRDDFVTALRAAYAEAPERPVWYPGSDARRGAAASAYPRATWSTGGTRALVEIGPGDDATALTTTEFFSPVLGVVSLRGTGQDFVDAAVGYANDRLAGTLGANVLAEPRTLRALGDGFERALARLRYGAIAVNTWTGTTFATPSMPWGAYPDGTLSSAPSGIGIVHNALLLADVERSVMRGPFRPFPRSVLGGERSVLPRPPWFVTSRTGATVSRGLTRFRIDHDVRRVAGTVVQAFRA